MMAAMQFLVKGDTGNFRAVIRANKEYRRLRPEFETDRKRNLERMKTKKIDERRNFSVLWRFYVKGKKTFNEIESQN